MATSGEIRGRRGEKSMAIDSSEPRAPPRLADQTRANHQQIGRLVRERINNRRADRSTPPTRHELRTAPMAPLLWR